MKIASVANVKAKFGAFLKASGQSPVVITRDGKAVAALIGFDPHEDIERLLLGCSPRLRRILSDARKRIRAGGGIAHEQFWKDAGVIPRGDSKRKSA